MIGCACACAGDDGGHRLPEQGHKPAVLIPSPVKIYALSSLSVPLAVMHLQRASVTNPRRPSPSTTGRRYRSVPHTKVLMASGSKSTREDSVLAVIWETLVTNQEFLTSPRKITGLNQLESMQTCEG